MVTASTPRRLLTLDAVLPQLKGLKGGVNGQWQALCPCPDHGNEAGGDTKHSLNVSEGTDGKLLMHCFAGCGFDKILANLDVPSSAGVYRAAARPKEKQKPKPTKKRMWGDESDRTFEALPPARDHLDVVAMLLEDYGLEMIPPDWRAYEHPRLGLGVVYRAYDIEGKRSYKFKSIARENGKRRVSFVGGDGAGGVMFLKGGASIVIVGGEEKAAAAWAAGYSVICPMTGEANLDDKVVEDVVAAKPEMVIVAHDADAAGRKANADCAAKLEAAGLPYTRIRIVNWPDDDALPKPGYDLNDVLQRDGLEGLRRFLDSSETRAPTVPPFEPWSLDDILAFSASNEDNILGERVIADGELALIVGPPDIGKSRLVTQMIFDFALGHDDWLGLTIHKNDLNILFLQTENGARRLQQDALAQLRGVPAHRIESAKRRIKIHVPQSPEDRDLRLDNDRTVERLKNTVIGAEPDIIFVDPYGDIFSGDNENDAVQSRRTIKRLFEIAQAHSPKTAIVLVHHARSGKAAAAGADGWDRQAYARGSKALMSIARSQINIAPGDEDGKTLIIACGKNNNGKKFEKFAVRLMEDRMKYEVDDTFDFDEWADELNGVKRKSKPDKHLDVITSVEAVGEPAEKKAVVERVMMVSGVSQATAYRRIDAAVKEGRVKCEGDRLAVIKQLP